LAQAQNALTPDVMARLEELRGWTPTALERLGVGREGQRVVLPVRGQSGELIGCLRYEPDPARRNGPKMLADAGVSRELFPPPEMIGEEEIDGLLLLVEGEPDVISAWSMGLPAVGVPGVGKWQDEWAARFAGRRFTVAVCFDCDEVGRTHAVRVATALTANGVAVRVINLAPDRDDGYDVTDFLAGVTAPERELRRMVEEAPLFQPPPAPDDEAIALRTVTVDEFTAVDEPGAEPVLGGSDGPVIAQGSDVVVYGDGGVGKTTMLIDFGFHLAAGDAWLGIGVSRPVRVLLVENEGPRPLFRKKLARKRKAWAGSGIADRVVSTKTRGGGSPSPTPPGGSGSRTRYVSAGWMC
jgi:hypothetical protein